MRKQFTKLLALTLASVSVFGAVGCQEQTANGKTPERKFTDYYEGFNLDNKLGNLVKDGNKAFP